LSRLTTQLPRSVVVAFWDGEEKGLLGSQHWADHPTIPLEKIKLAFNLDMIGRLASDTVTVYGSRTSVGLRQRLVRNNEASGLRFAYDFKNRDDSDHYTFYRKRIPYLMIYTGEHPDYHRPSDDADRINFEGMERITRLLLKTLVESAEAPMCGCFYERCRDETVANRIKYGPVPPRMGLTWSGKPLADGSLVVMAVDDNTPASKAGLRTGDCITHVGGVAVSECGELKDLIRKTCGELRFVVRKAGTDAVETVPIQLDGMPLPGGILTGLDETDPDVLVCTAVALRSEADLLGFRDGDRILRRTTGQTGSLDANSSWVIERGGLLLTLPERQD
ncbi:MAG TPA: M28 family peptidase, partial [Caulifigura sp.]|nr:M28 family peptidase [Caulifigura sp.]